MATFMVERYLPGAGAGQAAAAELLAKQLAMHLRAGQAAAAELLAKQVAMHLRAEGATVRHLRSLFVPEDEQCFVLFQAASAHALAEAIERVGIAYERIAEVIDLTAEEVAGSGRADSVNRHPY